MITPLCAPDVVADKVITSFEAKQFHANRDDDNEYNSAEDDQSHSLVPLFL